MIDLDAGADLPRPGTDRLLLYLIGPGFGESQIICFPDGRWMVIDGCIHHKTNLTIALLEELGCTRIDLLVITHPDLDHIRGVPELVNRFPLERVWRYPTEKSLRDLLVRWTSGKDTRWRRRLLELRTLNEQLAALLKTRNIVREVCANTRPWPPGEATYHVDCIAPTDAEQQRLDEALEHLIAFEGDRFELGEKFKAQLVGERPADDAPNLLSLAVAVRWNGWRILLAGDVENGDSSPFSGWKGVLDCLQQDQLLHLVSQVDLAKVAHHGSARSFHAPAWSLHAKPDRSTVALLTPFNRGPSPLPSLQVLQGLKEHAGHLGITANTRDAFGQAEVAGWRRSSTSAATSSRGRPILAASFGADGSLRLHASAGAALFQKPPRRTFEDHLLADDLPA